MSELIPKKGKLYHFNSEFLDSPYFLHELCTIDNLAKRKHLGVFKFDLSQVTLLCVEDKKVSMVSDCWFARWVGCVFLIKDRLVFVKDDDFIYLEETTK